MHRLEYCCPRNNCSKNQTKSFVNKGKNNHVFNRRKDFLVIIIESLRFQNRTLQLKVERCLSVCLSVCLFVAKDLANR